MLGSMFSSVEDVQYCEGCSVLWIMFSTVEDVQYCVGCSGLWRMFSPVGFTISTGVCIIIAVGYV